jgi:hypothetical protein
MLAGAARTAVQAGLAHVLPAPAIRAGYEVFPRRFEVWFGPADKRRSGASSLVKPRQTLEFKKSFDGGMEIRRGERCFGGHRPPLQGKLAELVLSAPCGVIRVYGSQWDIMGVIGS